MDFFPISPNVSHSDAVTVPSSVRESLTSCTSTVQVLPVMHKYGILVPAAASTVKRKHRQSTSNATMALDHQSGVTLLEWDITSLLHSSHCRSKYYNQ